MRSAPLILLLVVALIVAVAHAKAPPSQCQSDLQDVYTGKYVSGVASAFSKSKALAYTSLLVLLHEESTRFIMFFFFFLNFTLTHFCSD